MSNIDNRVVRMDFENRAFEKNAQESMKTISDLKKSLDFNGSVQSLRELETNTKSFRLGGLGGAVDDVKSKFSAMEIVAITALANITNSAVNAGKQLIKNVTVDQVTAGWEKYANKTTAVQTIMAATANQFSDEATQMAEVNRQLEKLSWFTDETSYNFVDMVSNIGKFTSNNIELEKSVTAMQGIATWAAISGANSTEASRAMYNLSQAIGTGAVTVIDWRSIENANMATAEFKQTAIDTAVELGQLKKVGDGLYETMEGNAVSVSNFRDALKDKWFTNDVLTTTLDRYGTFTTKLNAAFNETEKLTSELLSDIEAFKNGADVKDLVDGAAVSAERYGEILTELSDKSMEFGLKAFKAAQETKTFSEVIDYTKDAVSSQWMGIFESIFGGYLEAKSLWTQMSEDFYTLFVEPLENVRAVVGDAFSSKWEDLAKAIEEAGLSVQDFETNVQNAMDTKTLNDLIKEYGSLENALKHGAVSSDILKSAFTSLTEAAASNVEATGEVAQAFVNLEDVVRRVIGGEFGNGEARFKALTDAGYDYKVVQDLVNQTLAGQVVNYEALSDAQLKAKGYTDEQIAQFRELSKAAEDADSEIGKLLVQAGRPSGRQLFVESIQNAFKALIQTISIVKTAWHDIFPETTSERIYHLIEIIHQFTENTLNSLENNSEKIRATFRGLFSVLDIISTIIKGALKTGVNLINKLFNKLGINVWDVTAAFGDWLTKIRNLTVGNKKLAATISNLGSTIVKRVTDFITSIRGLDSVQKLTANFVKLYDSIKNLASVAWDWISAKFTSISKVSLDKPIKGTSALVKVVDFLATAINKLFEIFEKGKDWVSEFFDGLKDKDDEGSSVFSNITKSAQDMYKAIGESAVGSIGDYVSAGFTKLGEELKEKAKSIDFGQLLTLVKSGFHTYFIYQLSLLAKTIKTGIAHPITAIEDITKAFKGVLTSLSATIKEYGKNLKADSILKLSAAIGILAASLIGLSFIDKQKLADASATIIILAGVLVVLMKAFERLSNSRYDANLDALTNTIEYMRISIGGFLKSMAATAKIIAIGAAAALILLSLAAAVTTLIVAVNAISKAAADDPDATEAAITSIIFLILSLGTAVGLIGTLNTKNLLGAATSIAAIGVAMLLIVSALKNLQDAINSSNYGGAIVSLLTIFALLDSAVIAASSTGAGAAVVFLGIALSIKIIVGAMTDLAEAHGDIMQAAGIVAILIVAMGGIAAIMGMVNPTDMLSMSGALIAFSAAFAIAMGAIVLVGKNSYDAADGLEVVAKAMAAFVLAGIAITALGLAPALFVLANAMKAFGVAALRIGGMFALIGAGFALVAHAVGLLGPALEKLVTSWVNVSKTVISEADTLRQGMITAIGSMLDGVLANADKIMKVGATLVMSLVYGIRGAIDSIAQVGVDIVTAFINVVAKNIQPIANALFNLIVSAINAVAESIRSFGGPIIAALGNVASALIELLLKVVAVLVEGIPGIGPQISKKLFSWAEYFEKDSKALAQRLGAASEEIVHETTDSVTGAAQKDTPKIKNAFTDMISGGFDGAGPMIDDLTKQYGLSIPDGLASSIAGNSPKVSNSISDLFKEVRYEVRKEGGVTSLVTSEQGKTASELYAEGVISTKNIPISAAKSVSTEVAESFYVAPATISSNGAKVTSGFASGVSSKIQDAKNAAANVGAQAAASLNASNGAYRSGQNTTQGFINGMTDPALIAGVIAAGISVAAAGLNAIKKTVKEGSPSKVTTETGMNTSLGFILGILSKKKAVISASEEFAKASTDTMNATVMSAMNTLSDGAYTPTIRPVLDLTNLNSGMTSISSMFDSTKATALGASVRIGASDETRYNEMTAAMSKRDTAIEREFSYLRNSVNELIAKIDDLELRMDGDDVVAGLSGKFSRSIGRSAAIKQRGM